MASIGVYCFTAGGFLARLLALFLLPENVSGSMSAGHQFFGGSLKNHAQIATATSTKTPMRSSTSLKLLVSKA